MGRNSLENIAFNQGLQLSHGKNNYGDVVTEGLEQLFFSLRLQAVDVCGPAVEDYIATRNVGFDVAESGGSESGRQGIHFDEFVSADIDAAEEGDVSHAFY